MQLRCGGMFFNNHVIANLIEYVPVKEFWKSVNIWRRYGQKSEAYFLAHPLSFVDIFRYFYPIPCYYFIVDSVPLGSCSIFYLISVPLK